MGQLCRADAALIAELIKSQAFGQVLDTVPTPLPSDMVMVDGDIAGFDKDSTALRWIIGLGAGSAQVVGHFRVSEAAGGIVPQFTTSKSYAGSRRLEYPMLSSRLLGPFSLVAQERVGEDGELSHDGGYGELWRLTSGEEGLI